MKMQSLDSTTMYCLGIDIGSTTLKVVVSDIEGEILLSNYHRHHANIRQSLVEACTFLFEKLGNINFYVAMTGSVGMGYAKKLNLPFFQEVVAASNYISAKHPQVRTFIDIGGEDSKMVFLEKGKVPDIRMNGSCAGGTGAFIDQVAALLNVETAEINTLAQESDTIYPIASRCGVFSKTDIQNLISRNVSKANIAASVLNAVAIQVVASLARGTDINPKVFFCGGPFAYLPQLYLSFKRILNLNEADCIVPQNAQLIPASGCALMAGQKKQCSQSLLNFIQLINSDQIKFETSGDRLPPLFKSEHELQEWKKLNQSIFSQRVQLNGNSCIDAFLGVDSGSTTTKIVLINTDGNIIFSDYSKNNGDSFNAFIAGLKRLQKFTNEHSSEVRILASAVTGYGENLLKTAFNMSFGIVETMAHFIAARKINPDVSFVLDIGGQDMKAIFVENGSIKRIEINEACSSGCGSFIETFAQMLNYQVAEFANISCMAPAPCDLGTRCTVFMNSKVKQMLSEGAQICDIAAGFSYSVIKNCLFKVLKLRDVSELGNSIVVQGGTFKNLSVVRALELLTQKPVGFSDIPELMGAFGAALYAKENAATQPVVLLNEMLKCEDYKSSSELCPGCENHCSVRTFVFANGNKFYSGNNCEKEYSNRSKGAFCGTDQHQEKYTLLFGRKTTLPETPKLRIGIPRGLGIYENYPFWHALFCACGIQPVLSQVSTNGLYDSGIRSIMADNICFPAKLMHGHVMDLINRKVDRIFYPYVVFERKEDKSSRNSYNCPIVSGYSDVIKSSMEPAEQHNVPFDSPVLVFNDMRLLRKSCTQYLRGLGIDPSTIKKAISTAINAQNEYLQHLSQQSLQILQNATNEGRMVIVLAGRPYHIDPLIQHKISRSIAEMGIDVITENIASSANVEVYSEINAVSQWAYPNRVFKAAHYVANAGPNVHFVQLTSFGCGPDAFILDEVNNILRRKGKNLTILKIDDVNNIGSFRLRIRSLVESLQICAPVKRKESFATTALFLDIDSERTIYAPYFAEGYSEYLPTMFKMLGYKLVNLPIPDQEAVEIGLKYANNEVCYPATIVVGSIIKFLKSASYDAQKIAIGISQTGGQCRASNYLTLIKNAMIAAGFEHIPVVSVAFGSDSSNYQPGFQLKWGRIIRTVVIAMFYADCIEKLYHASASREKVKGEAKRLRYKYIEASLGIIESHNIKGLYELLHRAVNEFNGIIHHVERPVIGIVGEIYLKYNSFSQKHVLDWLTAQGIEVIVPTIYNFFFNWFANNHVNKTLNIKRSAVPLFLSDTLYRYIRSLAAKFDSICASFPYYRPFTNIFHELQLAKQVVNPAGNFGEGWLLPAEIASFAENGINSVISLQPFGCIANHVVSKGIEKRIKKVYPNMNLLFLDFDSGASEANILNRLHFMVENAKKQTSKVSHSSEGSRIPILDVANN